MVKFYLSGIIFIISFVTGIYLASHKPVWGDESYSQVLMTKHSYVEIFLGKNYGEGNRAPLFYLQQKLFCDVFHYKTPRSWLKGEGFQSDRRTDVVLRILPVIWMALFFAIIFLYFSLRFNLGTGLFGLLIAFTTPFLYRYWPEARPYGLSVLLTGCQMVLFLMILEEKKASYPKWLFLSLIQIALSMTSVLSIFQIAVVSFFLLLKERRWRQYILMTAIPVLLVFYYKPMAPSCDMIFVLTIDQMVRDTIARDRFYILLLYPFLLALYYLQTIKILPRLFHDQTLVKAWPFFLSTLLILGATIAFLAYLQAHATGVGQYVVSRHIIFLAPIGIIAVSYLIGMLWQAFRNSNWMRISVGVAVFLFLMSRMNRVVGEICSFFVNGIKS
ncbi:MAG: glycosyltransferase family 39 protein [Candidatus Omnitrophica bacterium]|nr:glycosyltransferase family 39 protein [Candidatus Omnitrophota bacterium]